MSNRYGIPEEDEKDIRARDKTCVYCRKAMKKHPRKLNASGPTLEHFNNDGHFDKKWNVAICCRRCNSSKGNKELLAWFKTPYCIKKKINQEPTAKPVKEYIRGRGRRRRRPGRRWATATQKYPRLENAAFSERKIGHPLKTSDVSSKP